MVRGLKNGCIVWLSKAVLFHQGGKYCTWNSKTPWLGCALILVISSMKASGSSANAWASASGLSSTMVISISPPSFLMRAVLPACILFKIATALFSQTFRSHSSTALWANSPCCAGAVRTVGVPSAVRKGLLDIFGVWEVRTNFGSKDLFVLTCSCPNLFPQLVVQCVCNKCFTPFCESSQRDVWRAWTDVL